MDLVQLINKGAIIFIAATPIGFQIANQETRRRSKIFKGSQRLGWAKFYENLSASPFNEFTCSQIRLAGQHL
jgi:hypothetical protein